MTTLLAVPLIAVGDFPPELTESLRQLGITTRAACGQDSVTLDFDGQTLGVSVRTGPECGRIAVDFAGPELIYRCRFGGGRRQALARAVGLKSGACPAVVDATAGLGRDAFVLAALGCRVHMIERSSLVAAVLADGLRRAGRDPRVGGWARDRLSLSCHDNTRGFPALPFDPEVIYLDPMFPARRKSALVKKEMRILKAVLGEDPDAARLLPLAIARAGRRVVVKRPAVAASLAGPAPDAAVKTARHRFDIYSGRGKTP